MDCDTAIVVSSSKLFVRYRYCTNVLLLLLLLKLLLLLLKLLLVLIIVFSVAPSPWGSVVSRYLSNECVWWCDGGAFPLQGPMTFLLSSLPFHGRVIHPPCASFLKGIVHITSSPFPSYAHFLSTHKFPSSFIKTRPLTKCLRLPAFFLFILWIDFTVDLLAFKAKAQI